MKLILYFFGLNIVLASSETTELKSLLERIESSIKRIDLRLARIKSRQNRDSRTYLRLEESFKRFKNDMDSKHKETMSMLSRTVDLMSDLKEKNQRLELSQSVLTGRIERLINETNIGYRHNTVVRGSTQTTVSSTKLVSFGSTNTTVRSKASTRTTPTPTSTTTTATTVHLANTETRRTTTSTPVTAKRTTTLSAWTSCKSVDKGGNAKDGVYKLDLPGKRQIEVFCSAGYVTIQRRFSGVLSFDKTFAEYEQGFGDVSGETWLGLTYLHELTRSRSCSLRVVLDVDSTTQWNTNKCGSSYASDCEGKTKTILADNFRISSASDLYRIQATSNSTDFTHYMIKESINWTSGHQFSAKDKGPKRGYCATRFGAVPAGFWYDAGCSPGWPNFVYTTTDTNYCSSSNKVCGQWWPYYFTSSLIQFRC